jgi:F-type H+-transporting ATPase subunit epsilon
MRLVVTTPTSVVVDVEDVTDLRADDRTGAFGIRPGHADFVTLLPVSVITWRGSGDRERFVLVRGGVLSVHEGNRIEVAARGAWGEDELSDLGQTAIEALDRARAEEDVTRTSEAQLHFATMRQIERVLQAGRGTTSMPPVLDRRGEGEGAG